MIFQIALIDEEDDQIIDVNDEDRKCGLPSKGGVKRRAEPNSFTVPTSMVNGLGRSILDEMQVNTYHTSTIHISSIVGIGRL